MSARLKGDVEWSAILARNMISNNFNKGLGSDNEATEFNAFGEICGTALCKCHCFFVNLFELLLLRFAS